MGQGGNGPGEHPGTGEQHPRYRSTEHIDPAAMREQVSRWLDEHPDSNDEQAVHDLAPGYREYHPAEAAIVLRSALFAEQRRRRQQ